LKLLADSKSASLQQHLAQELGMPSTIILTRPNLLTERGSGSGDAEKTPKAEDDQHEAEKGTEQLSFNNLGAHCIKCEFRTGIIIQISRSWRINIVA
jgi:hypothetical protein